MPSRATTSRGPPTWSSWPSRRRARPARTSRPRRWIDALPDELIRVRPVLSDAFAGSRLVRGEVEGVEAAPAGRRCTGWPQSREGTADGDGRRGRRRPSATCRPRSPSIAPGWPGSSATSTARWPTPGRALELVGEDDLVGRAAAAALLGLASWSRGDLEAAARWYDDAIADLEKAGYLSDVVGCSIALADMRRAQGRLSEAMGILQRGLALATRPGEPVLRGAADMHVGLSEILRERDDLAAASEHLAQSRELGEENGLPQNPYRSRVAGGADPTGGGRSGRRPRAPGRGRSPLRRGLLARGPAGGGPAGAGADRAGTAGRGVGLGARSAAARPIDDLDLRPRVRAHHARHGCSWRMASAIVPMTGSPTRGGCWRACWTRPRPAGGRAARSTSSSCRRSPTRPGATRRPALVARARDRPRGAGGLRADLRG